MRSKKALYNVLTNLLLQLVIIIYGFVLPKVIIEKFGSNVNGLVSSITQFITYISLLESGFGPVVKSLLYKPIADKNEKSLVNILRASEKFFKLISYIFLGYLVILCVVFPLIINGQFDTLFTVSLILIISISTFAEYFFGMTYKLYLQAAQETYVISLVQIIIYILNILLIILMVHLNCSIHIIKLVSCFVFIIRPLFQNYYVKKKYNIDLSKADDNYRIKQKWDGLSQHVAAIIHNNTDITVLTIFTSLAEVSVYSVYYLVVKAIKSLIQSFTSGIEAAFGDMIAKRENDNIAKKFNLYEILYFMIITVVFSSAMVLIVPFISIYTKNVTDANYIRYTFGYLLIISEFVWAIRLPYSSIVYSAGHFKETKNGAWLEAALNIIVSLILVNYLGIIGVIIGTIVAMIVRTFEFIYHCNKYIIVRNIWSSLMKIVLIAIQSIIIVLLSKYVLIMQYDSYLSWFFNALIVFILSCVVSFILNFVLFNKDLYDLKYLLIKFVKHFRNNKN